MASPTQLQPPLTVIPSPQAVLASSEQQSVFCCNSSPLTFSEPISPRYNDDYARIRRFYNAVAAPSQASSTIIPGPPSSFTYIFEVVRTYALNPDRYVHIRNFVPAAEEGKYHELHVKDVYFNAAAKIVAKGIVCPAHQRWPGKLEMGGTITRGVSLVRFKKPHKQTEPGQLDGSWKKLWPPFQEPR